MVNEELVIRYMGHAIKLARRFKMRDRDEAESIALSALVVAAVKFRPSGEEHDGAMFWAFAQKAIWGALVDEIRRTLGRHNRRKFVALSERHGIASTPFAALEARLMVMRFTPFLSNRQREVIESVLADEYGYDEAEAARWHRMNAITKMRRWML